MERVKKGFTLIELLDGKSVIQQLSPFVQELPESCYQIFISQGR